eukprot:7379878-Prymnesium_polylepis.2
MPSRLWELASGALIFELESVTMAGRAAPFSRLTAHLCCDAQHLASRCLSSVNNAISCGFCSKSAGDGCQASIKHIPTVSNKI